MLLTPLSLGNVSSLVEITGFGSLLAVLSNLCVTTPAVATAGPATIVGRRLLCTLGYEARTRNFTRKDRE